jgi:hypothetical protein
MKKLFLAFLFVSQIGFAVTANKVWRIPSGATLPAWGPVNLADGTNAITGALPSKSNLPTVGQQISSSSGHFTTTSTSFVDVTNLSVTLTTSGRPVELMLVSDGSGTGTPSQIICSTGAQMEFLRGATGIAFYAFSSANGESTTPATVVGFDAPAAGTYTYKVQVKRTGGSVVSITIDQYVLVAWEL